MSTTSELIARWQAAQAAADRAYASHLFASRQASISWGGNGQVIDAAHTASQAWKDADRVADLAFAAYTNACDAAACAATV